MSDDEREIELTGDVGNEVEGESVGGGSNSERESTDEDCEDIVVCWQCSDFCIYFSELLNILNEMTGGTNSGVTEDEIMLEIHRNRQHFPKKRIKDILQYACANSYVRRTTINGEHLYSVNNKLKLESSSSCARCGEFLIPYDCKEYVCHPEVKYVDRETFEVLAEQVAMLKKDTNDGLSKLHSDIMCKSLVKEEKERCVIEEYKSKISDLNDRNAKLQIQVSEKDKLISLLFSKLTTGLKENNPNQEGITQEKPLKRELKQQQPQSSQQLNMSNTSNIKVNKNNTDNNRCNSGSNINNFSNNLYALQSANKLKDPRDMSKGDFFKEFSFTPEKLSNGDIVDLSDRSVCSADTRSSDIESLVSLASGKSNKRKVVNNYRVKYQLCKHNHQFVTTASQQGGLGPSHGAEGESGFEKIEEQTFCISPEVVQEKMKMPPNIGRVRSSIRRSTFFKKVFA